MLIKTAAFVKFSDIATEKVMEEFSNSSEISFGDSDHTLICRGRFCEILNDIIAETSDVYLKEQCNRTISILTDLPQGIMIDLES